jgi:hypothetical protein
MPALILLGKYGFTEKLYHLQRRISIKILFSAAFPIGMYGIHSFDDAIRLFFFYNCCASEGPPPVI